jgi:hypothetical protein
VTICEEKKVEITTLTFFSNSAFLRFFRDFHYISYHISVSIRDIQIISTTINPGNIRLKPKTFKLNILLNIAL